MSQTSKNTEAKNEEDSLKCPAPKMLTGPMSQPPPSNKSAGYSSDGDELFVFKLIMMTHHAIKNWGNSQVDIVG